MRVRYANLVIALLDDEKSQAAINTYYNIGQVFRFKQEWELARHYYKMGMDLGDDDCTHEYKNMFRAEEAFDDPSPSLLDIAGGLLNSVAGIMNGGKPVGSYNSMDFSSDAFSGGSVDVASGRDYSYYKMQYDRWERRAKDVYEGLTKFGSRTKKGGKNVSGTSGGSWNGPSYVSLKKNLRDSQFNMKKIRNEAKRAGHSIPQSQYETVTVSY